MSARRASTCSIEPVRLAGAALGYPDLPNAAPQLVSASGDGERLACADSRALAHGSEQDKLSTVGSLLSSTA